MHSRKRRKDGPAPFIHIRSTLRRPSRKPPTPRAPSALAPSQQQGRPRGGRAGGRRAGGPCRGPGAPGVRRTGRLAAGGAVRHLPCWLAPPPTVRRLPCWLAPPPTVRRLPCWLAPPPTVRRLPRRRPACVQRPPREPEAAHRGGGGSPLGVRVGTRRRRSTCPLYVRTHRRRPPGLAQGTVPVTPAEQWGRPSHTPWRRR